MSQRYGDSDLLKFRTCKKENGKEKSQPFEGTITKAAKLTFL